jgi:uncharacterized membrane protein YfcA
MTDLTAIPIGLIIGIFGTLIGAGGGFLLVPLLIFLEPNWSTETVTAFSLAVVAANAFAGSLSYARLRRIDMASFPVFAAAAVPGAVFGAYLSAFVPRRGFDALLGCFILVTAALLFLSRRIASDRRGGATYRHLIDARGISYEWNFDLRLGIVGSALAGVLSSLLGIGGGIVHVPFLVAILGFPEHIATATSHSVLAVTAGVATLYHLVHGDFATHVWTTALTACGAVLGAPIGAKLSTRISGAAIARILAIALGAVGARLIAAAFFVGPI